MEQQEILEGNRLIAEFIGINPDIGFSLGHDMSGNEYFDKNYIYHSSWDWLIPAWSKIYVLMENLRGNEEAYNEGADYHDNFDIAMNHNDIETAFEICGEAIKWYSSKNKTT